MHSFLNKPKRFFAVGQITADYRAVNVGLLQYLSWPREHDKFFVGKREREREREREFIGANNKQFHTN